MTQSDKTIKTGIEGKKQYIYVSVVGRFVGKYI